MFGLVIVAGALLMFIFILFALVHILIMRGRIAGFSAVYIPKYRIRRSTLYLLNSIAFASTGFAVALLALAFRGTTHSLPVQVALILIGFLACYGVSRWSDTISSMICLKSIRNCYDQLLSTKQLIELEVTISYYEEVSRDSYAVRFERVPPCTDAHLEDLLFVLFMCRTVKHRFDNTHWKYPLMSEKMCALTIYSWAKVNSAKVTVSKTGKHFIVGLTYTGNSYVLAWMGLPKFYRVDDLESALKAASKRRISKSVKEFYTPTGWISINSLQGGDIK